MGRMPPRTTEEWLIEQEQKRVWKPETFEVATEDGEIQLIFRDLPPDALQVIGTSFTISMPFEAIEKELTRLQILCRVAREQRGVDGAK